MDRITLTRPDDLHLHLRDAEALRSVVPHTAAQFARALVMPNLKPPVRTAADAAAYRQRILDALPAGVSFEPLMTLYLTDSTTPQIASDAADASFVHAFKLYPAGATTNSDSGVTDTGKVDEVLSVMAARGLPLCVHAEVTERHIDIFDREAVFLETVLGPILERHPSLRVIVEHLTTADGVKFVKAAGDNVAASLTAHHLLLNRNAMFDGGIRPHHYCLPVLKRETHRQALLEAATSGSPKFFLGTDSAPHPRGAKESACGCAGMYTAAHGLELYAEAFDSVGAIDKLDAFASAHGAAFYGLPRNEGTVTLVRGETAIPKAFAFAGSEVVPFRAGGHTTWSVEG